MRVLSMRTGEGLSLVVAIHAPAGWASLGWAGCETNVAIPPSWEPEARGAKLAAKAVNRAGSRTRSRTSAPLPVPTRSD